MRAALLILAFIGGAFVLGASALVTVWALTAYEVDQRGTMDPIR